MKKILYSLIAVLAMVMSSCSNDDIEISRQTTFKINPATVVEGLYEYKAGDMQSLYNNEKLKIALFIYDRNGKLVSKDLQQFSAYTQIMTSNQMLPKGDYTGIAVSYVSSSIEFWEIVNTEQISTFKINDKGKIGGKSKILGVSVFDFNVSTTLETINVDIENAGCVAFVYYKNWKDVYGDYIETFTLRGKQASQSLAFDSYGNIDYSLESHQNYDYKLSVADYDSNYGGAVRYFFTFPIKGAVLCFYAENNDGKYPIGDAYFQDDLEKGMGYKFICDIQTDETEWYEYNPKQKLTDEKLYSKGTKVKQNVMSKNRLKYNYSNNSISIAAH